MLTTVVTLNPMHVYFDIDERTVLGLRSLIAQKKIKTLSEMTFRFELANGETVRFPDQGKINFEDNSLDAGTGTLQLRGEFDNAKGLSARPVRPAAAIPRRAAQGGAGAGTSLGSDQGQKFLYVVKAETDKDGNTVHKAEYRAGNDLGSSALAVEIGRCRADRKGESNRAS